MQFSFTNFFLIVVYAALSFSDSTESVSVADFKSEFTSSAIVPEVLATFNPSVEFYVGFNSDDGSKGLLTPGLNLSLTEAKAPFELSVANIANATNITSSSRFIVYLIGPDVPSRSNPTSRNVRHFLAGNLTLSSTNSSLISTAVVLQNTSTATNEYAAPAPSPNTGSHRYVYLIYEQPKALNTKSFASLGLNVTNRIGFNVTTFRTLAGLGASIGGSIFNINTDTNTTTTTATSTAPSSSNTATGTTSNTTTQVTSGSLMTTGGIKQVSAAMTVMCVGAALVALL